MKPSQWKFFFPADFGEWLSILGIGLGGGILFYALSLWSDWSLLFSNSSQALVGREVGDAMSLVQSPVIPRIGWIVYLFGRLSLSESAALSTIFWALVVLGSLLILGLYPRPVAFLAWLLHLACAESSGLLSYGADNMVTIGLFYLMIAPRINPWLVGRKFHRVSRDIAPLSGFHRRIVQLHLCLIYFFGGLAKCLGTGWWNGSNLWRSLTIPPFDVIPAQWIILFGFLLPSLGIAICLLEITYPFLIWWRPTRKFVLCSICAMHLGIGLMMGMYLFGGIMIVLNLAAFWPCELPAEIESIPPEAAPLPSPS